MKVAAYQAPLSCNNGLPPAKGGPGLVAETRAVDRARASENRFEPALLIADLPEAA